MLLKNYIRICTISNFKLSFSGKQPQTVEDVDDVSQDNMQTDGRQVCPIGYGISP